MQESYGSCHDTALTVLLIASKCVILSHISSLNDNEDNILKHP